MGIAGQQLNEKLCSPEIIEKKIDEMFDLCHKLQKQPRAKSRFLMMCKVSMYNFLQTYIWRFYN